MHRCLQLQEIAELICKEGFYDPENTSRQGILALAQTCRSLYDPAANVIWHRIADLRPLVDCIPETVWESVEHDWRDGLTAIQPNDLSRLRSLARRVRAFGVDEAKFEEIHTAEAYPQSYVRNYHYEALSLASGFTPLLMNVREVSMVNPDQAMLVHVNLFTTPEIRTLRIMATDDARWWRFHFLGFLNSMSERYPLLREFDLRIFGFWSESGPSAIENALRLCRWENLTTLTIDANSSTKILQDVLRRPSLKKIHITIPESETQLSPEWREDCVSIPLLEDITFIVPRISMVSNFIRSLGPKFRPIHLDFTFYNPEDSSTKEWQEIMQALHVQVDPLTLVAITLDGSIPDDLLEEEEENWPNRCLVNLSDSPLFTFRNLKEVTIQTHGVLALDNEVLRRMPESWPRVQVLRIWGQSRNTVEPSPLTPTLEGLFVLADNCPDLWALSLDFYAGVTKDRVSKPFSKPRFGLKLEELDVRDSCIDRPELIAPLLAELFPCIKTYLSSGRSDEKWAKVFELHGSVRAGRLRRSDSP